MKSKKPHHLSPDDLLGNGPLRMTFYFHPADPRLNQKYVRFEKAKSGKDLPALQGHQCKALMRQFTELAIAGSVQASDYDAVRTSEDAEAHHARILAFIDKTQLRFNARTARVGIHFPELDDHSFVQFLVGVAGEFQQLCAAARCVRDIRTMRTPELAELFVKYSSQVSAGSWWQCFTVGKLVTRNEATQTPSIVFEKSLNVVQNRLSAEIWRRTNDLARSLEIETVFSATGEELEFDTFFGALFFGLLYELRDKSPDRFCDRCEDSLPELRRGGNQSVCAKCRPGVVREKNTAARKARRAQAKIQ